MKPKFAWNKEFFSKCSKDYQDCRKECKIPFTWRVFIFFQPNSCWYYTCGPVPSSDKTRSSALYFCWDGWCLLRCTLMAESDMCRPRAAYDGTGRWAGGGSGISLAPPRWGSDPLLYTEFWYAICKMSSSLGTTSNFRLASLKKKWLDPTCPQTQQLCGFSFCIWGKLTFSLYA